MASIAAVLDACVLYPARLRDLLLSLAAADLFRPIWSDLIHEEWIANVLGDRPDLTRSQLERTRALMDHAFPDALTVGFEATIATMALPDPGDRHVLACAIHAEADVIVTINLNDFPAAALAKHAIAVTHPDALVEYLFELDEDEAANSIAMMRRRLRAPSMTPKGFVDSIERLGMPLTVARLRRNLTRI